MAFFKSRISVAIIGLILIGGVSAAIAIMTSPQPFRTALVETGNTSAQSTATSAPAATATATRAPVVVTSSAPAPTATTAPQPTATSIAVTAGQSIHINGGRVVSVNTNANSFVVRSNGVNYTIDVIGSTNFSGSATSFSALQVGMQAEIQGTGRPDGTVLASEVNASADN